MVTLRIHCGSVRGRPWLIRLNSVLQAVTQASHSGVHFVEFDQDPQPDLARARGGSGFLGERA